MTDTCNHPTRPSVSHVPSNIGKPGNQGYFVHTNFCSAGCHFFAGLDALRDTLTKFDPQLFFSRFNRSIHENIYASKYL